MGRYLDSAMVNRIGEIMHLPVPVERVDAGEPGLTRIGYQNPGNVTGSMVLFDIHEVPAACHPWPGKDDRNRLLFDSGSHFLHVWSAAEDGAPGSIIDLEESAWKDPDNSGLIDGSLITRTGERIPVEWAPPDHA